MKRTFETYIVFKNIWRMQHLLIRLKIFWGGNCTIMRHHLGVMMAACSWCQWTCPGITHLFNCSPTWLKCHQNDMLAKKWLEVQWHELQRGVGRCDNDQLDNTISPIRSLKINHMRSLKITWDHDHMRSPEIIENPMKSLKITWLHKITEADDWRCLIEARVPSFNGEKIDLKPAITSFCMHFYVIPFFSPLKLGTRVSLRHVVCHHLKDHEVCKDHMKSSKIT